MGNDIAAHEKSLGMQFRIEQASLVSKRRLCGGILLVFVFALGVRLVHYRQSIQTPMVLDVDRFRMIDSIYYDVQAKRIVGGERLGSEAFFVAPAYEYWLAFWYAILGERPVRVFFVQAVLGAATCGLIFGAGYLLFGPLAAAVAGVLSACFGLFMYYETLLMPNGLILALHVAALLALCSVARWPTVWRCVVSGVLIGLSAISHGTGLLLLPVVMLWFWLGSAPGTKEQRIVRGALILGAAVLTIAPVTVRNYVVGGDLVLLTSNGGLNLYIGNNPEATGSFIKYRFPYPGAHIEHHIAGFERSASQPSPSQVSRALTQRALQFMFNHPGEAVGLLWTKLRLMLNDCNVFINDQYYFYKRFVPLMRLPLPNFGFVAVGGLVGAVICLPRWRDYLFLYGFTVSQLFAYTLMFVLARYRLVLIACLLLFFGAGVSELIRSIRERRYAKLATAAVAGTIAAVVVYWPVPGFFPERGFGQQYAKLGAHHLAHGRLSAAAEAYSQAVTADCSPWPTSPHQIECLIALGQVAERQEQWSSALGHYLEARDRLSAHDDDWSETSRRELRLDVARVRQQLRRPSHGAD